MRVIYAGKNTVHSKESKESRSLFTTRLDDCTNRLVSGRYVYRLSYTGKHNLRGRPGDSSGHQLDCCA